MLCYVVIYYMPRKEQEGVPTVPTQVAAACGGWLELARGGLGDNEVI